MSELSDYYLLVLLHGATLSSSGLQGILGGFLLLHSFSLRCHSQTYWDSSSSARDKMEAAARGHFVSKSALLNGHSAWWVRDRSITGETLLNEVCLLLTSYRGDMSAGCWLLWELSVAVCGLNPAVMVKSCAYYYTWKFAKRHFRLY